MTVKDRLQLFIKHEGLTNKAFEVRCGLGNGFVSKVGDSIRREKLFLISQNFPKLNVDWVINEKGSMLTDGGGDEVIGDQPHIINNKAIKYYPNVDGSMGGLQFLENPNETTFDISIPGYSDCKYAVNAYGDSMYPLIQSGQIVLLVPWQESFIDWGRIYLVVTKSGYRAIKRIFPASDSEHILCKSENGEKFPPFEIEKNDITNIFLVKGWICRNEI